MSKVLLTVTLCVVICEASAQLRELSSSSIRKLSSISSPKKKLLAYEKLYRRDSIRFDRMQRKKLRHAVDSTYLALRKKYTESSAQTADSTWMQKRRDIMNGIRSMASDSIVDVTNQFQQHTAGFLSDASAIGELEEVGIPKNEFPITHFDVSSPQELKIPHGEILDGQKDSASLTNYVSSFVALPSIDKPASAIADLRDTLDFVSLKTVLSRAERYLIQHAPKNHALTKVKERVARLASKYRSFTSNANEVEGIKQRCLKGYSFRERIFVGNDLNATNLAPLSATLIPQIGFKLNRNWVSGLTAAFLLQASDSMSSSSTLAISNAGIGLFTSLILWKSFFVTAEWDRVPAEKGNRDKSFRPSRDTGYIGIGKKMLIHPKVFLVTKMVYNISSVNHPWLDVSRIQLRIGVQLSELAIREPKPLYDPNRW